MLKKLSMISVCAASAFALNTAELNINDSDLEVMAKFDMGQFNDSVEPETVFVGVRLLNGHKSHSDDEDNSLDGFLEANFLMQREIGNKGITIGLGVKLNATQNKIKDKSVDFMSIPLGVEAGYRIPASDLIPMYVGASLYYAPSVLSLGDADNFLEYRINYDIEVIKNGRITLGYRSINTNYESDNFNYNKSLYGGFKFAF